MTENVLRKVMQLLTMVSRIIFYFYVLSSYSFFITIIFIVSNEQLRGKTELERTEIIQWFGFADSEILPASCAWVFPLLGIMPYNKQVLKVYV